MKSDETISIEGAEPMEFALTMFPQPDEDVEVTRRRFLQVMGASLALASASGVGGCTDKPTKEHIVPYVKQPDEIVPGNPLTFASAMPLDGYARGVLVTSRDGRPIKIEGNPDHPASLGGTDVFMQASILSLYDPDRSKVVTHGGDVGTWGMFFDQITTRLARVRARGGAGLYILSSTCTSPTLAAQRQELLAQFPKMRWHTFDPLARRNTAAGLRAAFGRPLSIQYDFAKADVIVSLDSDFLFDEPASPRYARQFIDGRRVRPDRLQMNRLYVIESTLSITGSMADHRLAARPSEIVEAARAFASALKGNATANSKHARWISAALADLKEHHGRSLVLAGESQPPEVHALAHALNHALGNVGSTIHYTQPVELDPPDDDAHSLASLVADMRSGKVDTLLILGGNPAYTAPADLGFVDALQKLSSSTALTARLGQHDDETSLHCQWHLPESHYLEMWSDARAFDGTASIIQPIIAPLYGTKSVHEVLEILLGRPDRTDYEIVRGFWQSHSYGGDFDAWWKRALTAGVVENSAFAIEQQVSAPRSLDVAGDGKTATTSLDLVFRADYTVHDGSFANNAWMQELPKPFTKLTWDNAALIAPQTAMKLGLQHEEVVTLTIEPRSIEAIVYVLPGLPENVVTVHLGYGRERAGQVGSPPDDDEWSRRGFNAYALRTSEHMWSSGDLSIQSHGRKRHLVTTQNHHAMAMPGFPGPVKREQLQPNAIVTPEMPEDEREVNNRRLVRVITLPQFQANRNIVKDLGGEGEKKPLLSLYPGPENGGWDYSKGYQWGMSIDMTACIGCNACIVACQAENNIPVVGKHEVDREREMHWIRIDDYFGGTLENPQVHHQPVPCMHCENAPCEYVCPVGATTHSSDGLNQMTYNRCVGTRYCSNNCPYKVRRFNFLGYADAETTEQRKLQRNPDVTVRTNGVMEKCSYCIQRIMRTRIEVERMQVELSERARRADEDATRRQLNDESQRREADLVFGLQTACQQACPTRAIVFGSINPIAGKKMEVAELKSDPLDYSLLHELTTKPRTTYRARVRNPNPALESNTGGVT